MKNLNLHTMLIFFSLFMAACSSNQTATTAAIEPAPKKTAPLPEPEITDNRSDLEKQLWDRRLVYFEFDQSHLSERAKQLILEHAKYLNQNPNIKVRLEGHADERGTREYNMALGERRAKAVEQLLISNGVPATGLDIVSYGEELPAVPEPVVETSHAQNRRVEFHYLDGELAGAPLSHEKANVADEGSAPTLPFTNELGS